LSKCKELEDTLVSWEELSSDEIEALERHLAECGSCQNRLSEYRSLMKALGRKTRPVHVDAELLTRYAVHRSDPGEPDFDGRRLSADEVQPIESHLATCAECREAVESVMAEYRQIDDYLGEAGLPATLPRAEAIPAEKDGLLHRLRSAVTAWAAGLQELARFRPVPMAAAAAFLMVLVWISPAFRGDADAYYGLAELDHGDLTFLTRGQADVLGEGLAAFAEERYSDAIVHLEGFLTESGDATSADYARYVLGLAYLHTAQSDFLGRFRRVDTELVARGISHLAEAARRTESRRLREDAAWFQAKGYLLKPDREQALQALREVEALDGRRADEARRLIAAIEGL
jgi:bacterioferritin-associated ferredoxin